MEGKAKLLFAVALIVVVVIILCIELFLSANIPENLRCAQDSDCVPASCCHVNSTVNKQFAPSCVGIKCTMECAPNTLDCGQGEIKCIHNVCRAVPKK